MQKKQGIQSHAKEGVVAEGHPPAFAPCCSSTLAASWWPAAAASKMGVWPSQF